MLITLAHNSVAQQRKIVTFAQSYFSMISANDPS
ncbi:MAG: hypothetical protein ACI898_001564, partial [Flavobacteriales bacterium]